MSSRRPASRPSTTSWWCVITSCAGSGRRDRLARQDRARVGGVTADLRDQRLDARKLDLAAHTLDERHAAASSVHVAREVEAMGLERTGVLAEGGIAADVR